MNKRSAIRLCTHARSYGVSRVLQYPRVRPNITSSLPRDIETKTEESTSTTIPWYVEYNERFEDEYPMEQKTRPPLPELPHDAPKLLPTLTEYLSHTLGLTDLTLLDLRRKDTPWGPDTIMLLCTANSERQLRSAADSLKGFLRPQGINPHIEGLINWENTRVKRRRRRKMLGRANYQVEDDSLTWLFVDVGHSGLIIQMFTAKGRDEYRLEELWGNKANNEVVVPPVAEVTTPWRSVLDATGTGVLSRRMFSTRVDRRP